MTDEDSLHKGDFEPGTKVTLSKEYTYLGKPNSGSGRYPRVGDIGVVQAKGQQKSREELTIVAIDWPCRGLWTDVDCVEKIPPPVTDEELREVMESLGNYEPLGDLADVLTLLRMHERGELNSDQVVNVLKIDLGIKSRTDISLILGNAITMASKGEIDTRTLTDLVEFVENSA